MTDMKLTVDFETRSPVDLKKSGAYKYAEHPETTVLCFALKMDNAPPVIWTPAWVQALGGPEGITDNELFRLLKDADEIEAHNAGFERVIWDGVCTPRFGWPQLQVKKLFCSAAKAAMCGLPRSLEQASVALGLPVHKDAAGYKLMLKMCKPRPATKLHPELRWHETPEQFTQLINYCLQDVEVEYALSQALPDLSRKERQVWLMDMEINTRGVQVDVDTARLMLGGIDDHTHRLLAKTRDITGGAVHSPRQIAASLAWLADQGVQMECLDKAAVTQTLASPNLTGPAREFLEIRQSLGRSSTTKYETLLRCACADGRMRGTILYHGASTGRFSGRLFQPQNLPRGSFADTDRCIEAIQDHGFDIAELLWGDAMDVAATCIRGMIVAAPGHRLMVADYSSIEARVLAWVAGEEEVLRAFEDGLDLYKVAASSIFGVPYEQITKSQRQVGKTSILALGYAGGIGAYAAMAKNYGIDLETLPAFIFPTASSDEREKSLQRAVDYVERHQGSMSLDAAVACDIIKAKWRAANPRVVAFWYGVSDAASDAVALPGEVFSFRNISFKADPRFLRCKLPSGRFLYYPKAEIRPVTTPWGDTRHMVTHHGVHATTGKWVRFALTGGRLTENIVQAISRDILVEAMLRLERAGYPVVMHVHDEIVAEVPEGFGTLDGFVEIMAQPPAWAGGCPIGAEGWVGKRYRK